MHRFFVDKENITEDKVTIEGEDVKHIKNALRLKIDDEITVCDGENSDYLIKIQSIENNQVIGKIINQKESGREAPLEVILYQGLPKSSKMDLIIQKAIELGVKKIVPIETKRTVVKIQNEKKEQKKLERWNRIALEAAKQCKRGIVPTIGNVIKFDEMIQEVQKDFVIVPYENEDKIGTREILKQYKGGKKVSIIIGPEGGFEEEEITKLIDSGANSISLGPRILRTETAGFTTIAVVMYELGDIGVI